MVIEFIGWVGSAFIVASLSMTSILKLRLLGLVGAITFSTYGVLLGAWPIAAVNTAIVGIHLWFLRELLTRPADSFRLLDVAESSRYLRDFLDFYRSDIDRFFPGYRFEPSPGQHRWFILRDMVPAGLLIGTWTDDATLVVDLDFAIPQYRDLRLGRYAFSAGSGLVAAGNAVTVIASAQTSLHADYLNAVGFVGQGDGTFQRMVGS